MEDVASVPQLGHANVKQQAAHCSSAFCRLQWTCRLAQPVRLQQHSKPEELRRCRSSAIPRMIRVSREAFAGTRTCKTRRLIRCPRWQGRSAGSREGGDEEVRVRKSFPRELYGSEASAVSSSHSYSIPLGLATLNPCSPYNLAFFV